MAPRRHHQSRSRETGPTACQGPRRTGRRGTLVELRRLPHAHLAARQAPRGQGQHLGRLPTQGPTPHPAHPRCHPDQAPSRGAPRAALRSQDATHRRQPGARSQVGVGDPPHHPRRPQRRRRTRHAVSQCRSGGEGTQASFDRADRTGRLDRPRTSIVSAGNGWAPAVSRSVDLSTHRDATQRTLRTAMG